jgi:hypothetical protein
MIKKTIDINLNYNIEKYVIPDNMLKKILSGHWVDKKCISVCDILTSNYKITWTFLDKEHVIYIKCTDEQYNYLTKERITILLNIINYIYSQSKCNHNIVIYLILSLFKKNIPSYKKEIICPKHINSGYTDKGENYIVVWREEEFEKVLLHELLHLCELDNSNDEHKINSPFKITGIERYFEAITDYYAILFYLVYISILTHKSVYSLFQIEYQFIKNQAIMMNKYLNLNNSIIIKQESSAFEYYIVKYMIFFNTINNNISVDIVLINKILNKENHFTNHFTTEDYINVNSARMTLIQFK